MLKGNKQRADYTTLPAPRAIEEFVSRNTLTHVVIDFWYENFFHTYRNPSAIFLPHVTRAQLSKVSSGFAQIKHALIPFVLYDVLRGAIGHDPVRFIQQLHFLRSHSKRYKLLREMFATVMTTFR